jgi:hypothetical protein
LKQCQEPIRRSDDQHEGQRRERTHSGMRPQSLRLHVSTLLNMKLSLGRPV